MCHENTSALEYFLRVTQLTRDTHHPGYLARPFFFLSFFLSPSLTSRNERSSLALLLNSGGSLNRDGSTNNLHNLFRSKFQRGVRTSRGARNMARG